MSMMSDFCPCLKTDLQKGGPYGALPAPDNRCLPDNLAAILEFLAAQVLELVEMLQ